MTYQQKRGLAIGLTIAAGVITLVQAGNADVLGLTLRMLAWLGILNGAIAVGLGFLPSVRGEDQQIPHIANRVMELSPAERLKLRDEIDRRHADAATDDERRP